MYTGIKAPEGEDNKNWVERDQLLFKSTEFGDDKDRAWKNQIIHGHILQEMLPIIITS